MRKNEENIHNDELYKKYQEYSNLDRCKIEYRLSGGKKFELEIDKKALPHLMGLHYLTDIRQLARFADKDDKQYTSKEVLRDIRNGVLNDSLIKSSIYFSKIEDRYNNFTEQNISSLLKASKVIIDFNPNVVNGSGEKYESDKQYGSVLKCKYLFYEKTSAESEHYNHLSVAIAPSSGYYLESYFTRMDNEYLKNQRFVKIEEIIMRDKTNNIVFQQKKNVDMVDHQ